MTDAELDRRKVKILYEDNQLIAAVKPPNMPSQGDPSGDVDILSLLKSYVARKYNKPGEAYLGLVHRLDRPVGGVMVFARTSKAAARLGKQFSEHTNKKLYLALLEAELKQPTKMTDYLTQKQGQNVRIASADTPGAKKASLLSEPVAYRDGLTLTKVTLETGRKHQIRAQHAHAGYPLWGDNRYGHGRSGMQIALWAVSLTIEHPTKHEPIEFFCLPPMEGQWLKFETELKQIAKDHENIKNKP